MFAIWVMFLILFALGAFSFGMAAQKSLEKRNNSHRVGSRKPKCKSKNIEEVK